MHFTVKNTGKATADVQLAGWLQNAVGRHAATSAAAGGATASAKPKTHLFLDCAAEGPAAEKGGRPPIVFADFEGKDYGDWKATGEAFGTGPVRGTLPGQQPVSGYEGEELVNSWVHGDAAVGKLTSPEFTIERRFVSFLIGGGNNPGAACINLLLDGKVVRTATGKDNEWLEWRNWDVRDLAGKTAHIEIVDDADRAVGPHQHRSDRVPRRAARPGVLADRPDFGTMGLALLGRQDGDAAAAALPDADHPPGLFDEHAARGDDATARSTAGCAAASPPLEAGAGPGSDGDFRGDVALPQPEPARLRQAGRPSLRHALRRRGRRRRLCRGQFRPLCRSRRGCGARRGTTRRCRTGCSTGCSPNTSILATSTCHRFADGRFYGWEGVGCCVGTCDHVWHYAHAAGPAVPRAGALAPARCRTSARAGKTPAWSASAAKRPATPTPPTASPASSCAAYREHQMSADDAFLKRNWPKIKKATEYLLGHDTDHDGVLKDAQPNTLDTAYFGPNSAMTSLYLAALRAAEEMAREVGDDGVRQEAAADLRQRQREDDGRPVGRRIFLPQTGPETPGGAEDRRRLFRRSGVRPELGVPGRPGPHPARRQDAAGAQIAVEVQLDAGRGAVPQGLPERPVVRHAGRGRPHHVYVAQGRPRGHGRAT